jgi:DNA-binding transcriptional ArsR family regulator
MKQSEPNQLLVQDLEIRKAHLILRALIHPVRLKMLRFIHQQEETVVSNIYNSMDLVQPVASLHLAELRKAGILKTSRKGRNISYSINYDRLNHVQGLIKML